MNHALEVEAQGSSVMAENPEDPLVLLEMLEVLGACGGGVSYADICVFLSGRFCLDPLLELRSLLYSTACRDPCFPSTLFRERLHPPCSNRLSAAADVVSLFNLLTRGRRAPPLAACQVCGTGLVRCNWAAPGGGAASHCTYENLPCDAFSQPLSHTHSRGSMQETAPPEDISAEDETPETNAEVRLAQKRSAFKDGSHSAALQPMEAEDLTQSNPYPDAVLMATQQCSHDHSYAAHPNLNPYEQPRRQARHESLDELQSSTYFGPTESCEKIPVLQIKSHSLDIDSRSADERPEVDSQCLQKPRSERSVLDRSGFRKGGAVKISFDGSSFDIPGFDPRIVSSVRDTFKRLSGLSLDAWYDWSPSSEGPGPVSVSTQTEPADRRALRSLMLADKLSVDNPDIAEDDISAIFRFLDDISMCGSMAVLPGAAGGPQEGGGGPSSGLPERRERLGKLRRLFHSMEAPEEGVRWGVGRLLQRVADLEQQLEPITELREQLALVLSTLTRLEQRERLLCPHTHLASAGPGGQQQGSTDQGSEGSADAAAKRRRLFVRRGSRGHTESGSEAHRDGSVSFSRETYVQPAKVDHVSAVYKRDGSSSQEMMGFHLVTPDSHNASRRTSVHSTTHQLSERPRVTWSQSDLSPLDLQAPESLDFWTDEIYTPASDRLLRRSHSYTRCSRTQTFRIAALSITATIILILIIVIPVSTA